MSYVKVGRGHAGVCPGGMSVGVGGGLWVGMITLCVYEVVRE